jgi:DUF1009 family protein
MIIVKPSNTTVFAAEAKDGTKIMVDRAREYRSSRLGLARAEEASAAA